MNLPAKSYTVGTYSTLVYTDLPSGKTPLAGDDFLSTHHLMLHQHRATSGPQKIRISISSHSFIVQTKTCPFLDQHLFPHRHLASTLPVLLDVLYNHT